MTHNVLLVCSIGMTISNLCFTFIFNSNSSIWFNRGKHSYHRREISAGRSATAKPGETLEWKSLFLRRRNSSKSLLVHSVSSILSSFRGSILDSPSLTIFDFSLLTTLPLLPPSGSDRRFAHELVFLIRTLVILSARFHTNCETRPISSCNRIACVCFSSTSYSCLQLIASELGSFRICECTTCRKVKSSGYNPG